MTTRAKAVQLPISTISDVRFVKAQFVADEQANLSVYQTDSLIPFPIRRIFTVHACATTKRGRHAHKACSQAMACLSGGCTVTVDDGVGRKSWYLDHPSMVLIVPPLLWCEQDYDDKGTILIVMCDHDYEQSEYLRDYHAFLAYRKTASV